MEAAGGVKQVSKPHVELGITLFEEMFKSEQERTLTLVESMLVGQGKVKRPEASLCVTSGIRAEGAGRSHRKEEGLREDGGPAMIDAPSSVGHAPAPSLQGSTESSSAGQPDKRQGAAAGQLSIDARTIVGSAIAKTGRMLKLQPIDKKHEKYRAPDVKKPI
uniref:Uncharacterized protein n=1 Tax=Guillardia theta TaxID=55529 RepID=A0A7S4LZR7_GUITH|mmetsp:Transcript_10682/g.35778  ORF Transcript_10682/g.35778 Transcript_10682/m.35778 type:complete len:162 (+) Transcript_10682:749-1234(+)